MKSKILIFSFKIPFPLSQGGAIAQYFFLKKLITFYDITFITVVNNESQKKSIKALQDEIPSLKIEYFENKKKDEDTFFSKLVKFIFKIERKILKLSKLQENKKSRFLKADFHNLIDENFLIFFEKKINQNSYDLIQFEFYESLALLPFVSNKTKKMVIHHEIRSKRNKLLNSSKPTFDVYNDFFNEIVENALLTNSDSIVVFNDEDKNYLKDLNVPIHVSPFGIPEELIQKKEASKKFKRFLFIGGEFHYPNREGLEWFLDSIYLPNRDVISWPIYIIGFWSNNTINKYSQHKDIIFSGYVSDLNSYYEESVMIVPILSGSGIRTKILTSFANKIPVFATEFASEGLLDIENGNSHIALFNNDSEFLNLFLNKNENDLIKLSNIGYQYYMSTFSYDKLLDKRIYAIESTLKR